MRRALAASAAALPALICPLVLLGPTASPAEARVIGLAIARREAVLDGAPFGLAGPYEKLVGTIYYAIDPANPRNRAVVDLDEAPRNSDGEVEFSADLYILRPKDASKGNGSLLLEVPNRGGKGMLALLDQAAGSLDPTTPEEFGDGFLLERGFTLAWVGWQFDVRDEPGRMRLHAPRAAGTRGLVRSDFVVAEKTTFQPIGHSISGTIGGTEYPPADPASSKNPLTVRDRPLARRAEIPRGEWTLTAEGIDHAKGFEPGLIYELIYEASDPALVGLGLVAVRDLASYAKHDPAAIAPATRAIAFGISQSGRFLRHFLYQGFNADEQGRRALDGVMAHVAGAGRGSFNHRFAQPSRDGQPLEALFYPTDLFPFADAPLEDGHTGRKEGLLDRLANVPVEARLPGRSLGPLDRVADGPVGNGRADSAEGPLDCVADARVDGGRAASAEDSLDRTRGTDVAPRIFYTNTSYEYWSRAGSLIHTTPDGKADVDPPPGTRIYHLAGLQHFPRPLPPQRVQTPAIRGRWVMNPNPSAPTMRALVVAMHDWLACGVEPPPSRFPRIDDGTLVALDAVRAKFPAIPGVELPRDVHLAYRVDYGPDWEGRGIITEQPPRVGEPFVSLVPDVDADGNDRGGIRIPQIEAPVATYTPWNLRDPSIGAPWARVSFLGSYFPLARNEEDRSAAGDPRRSLAERYASFEEYLGRYAQAARRLITERFLLPEDLEGVLARGVQEWRYANEGFERPLLTSADDLYRLTIAPPPDARVSYGDEPFEFGEPRLPEGPGPHPVAIVVHGGCWLAQYDMAHARAMSEALASAGIAAWTVEYRRVGDEGGGWSGTFLDVARGADHLRVLARSYPLDLSRVIAVGHSAGGQFALWLAARERLPAGSPLRAADPVRLRGVVGLAAAGDLAFLHERGVCGDVIDKLMGGSPASVPDRYATGSPAQLVPLGTRQILISGARDELWSSVAARYIEAARAAGADLRVIEAPESGHFEMIDPSSSTWPFIRDAALELLGK